MSDKKFKLLRKHQKICYNALANYSGDLSMALSQMHENEVLKWTRNMYAGVQVTDFDLERLKIMTCSAY